VKTRISGRAKRELLRLDDGWRAHRDASDLFLDEFQAVVGVLEEQPKLGLRYHAAGEAGVRRVLMQATRHHIYYVEVGDELIILSVWSAVRGSQPKL